MGSARVDSHKFSFSPEWDELRAVVAVCNFIERGGMDPARARFLRASEEAVERRLMDEFLFGTRPKDASSGGVSS